jgi:hypothetical protein
MIKNKEITVRGIVYLESLNKRRVQDLHVICTNDEKGKTLSVDNGTIQFSIPMDQIAEYFKGDYRR